MRRQLNELITQLLSSRTAKLVPEAGKAPRGLTEAEVEGGEVVEAKVQWEIFCLCKWQSQRARHISIIVKRNACSEFMLRTTTITKTTAITNNGAREQSRAVQKEKRIRRKRK